MIKKLALIFLVAAATLSTVVAAPWEKLEGCTLVENAYMDGDSFHVIHEGKEYIFRLYFVDAPETNAQFPDRVAQQAAYFGCSPDEIVEIGKEAKDFAVQTLGETSFSVWTRWQNAMGASALPRYYAMIEIGGKDFSALLVENGLARIYGKRITLPDGTTSKEFRAKLYQLEDKAKQAKVGAWGCN